jgi:hypothetical protein
MANFAFLLWNLFPYCAVKNKYLNFEFSKAFIKW